MEIITDLRQKHLSNWTKALRELKPDDMKSVTEMPEVEFDGVTVKAAIMAGWIVGMSDPDGVDEMKGGEVNKASAQIWEAFNDARRIDPN